MNIMQTHFANSLPVMSSIEYIDYINIYKDSDGKRHYSCEEFSVSDEGIFSFDDALDEAFRLCVLGNWKYVKTLCDVSPCTRKLQSRLGALENAASIVKEFGEM